MTDVQRRPLTLVGDENLAACEGDLCVIADKSVIAVEIRDGEPWLRAASASRERDKNFAQFSALLAKKGLAEPDLRPRLPHRRRERSRHTGVQPMDQRKPRRVEVAEFSRWYVSRIPG